MGKKYRYKRKRYFGGEDESSESTFSKESGPVDVVAKRHWDPQGGHYHLIMDTFDGMHASVSFTHTKKSGKNANNYLMDKNPFGDSCDAYLYRQGVVDKTNKYYDPRNATISQNDYDKACRIAQKAKEKFLRNKKK